MAQKSKEAKLDIKLTNEQKSLFEYVAALEGRKLNELMVIAMQKYAISTIDENERINRILETRKDQAIFIEALSSPKEPGTELKKALSRYKKQISHG